MTVTNAAPTVTRNAEIDTLASTSELRLDSIVLLKKQWKCSVKNIASPSSFLRTADQDSDLNAMEKLRLRFLRGNSLPRLRAEKQVALKKSTDLGNPFVMDRLAANDIIRSF